MKLDPLSFLRTTRRKQRGAFAVLSAFAVGTSLMATVKAYDHDWLPAFYLGVAAFALLRLSLTFTFGWERKSLMPVAITYITVGLPLAIASCLSAWLYLDPSDGPIQVLLALPALIAAVTALLNLNKETPPAKLSLAPHFFFMTTGFFVFPLATLATLCWYNPGYSIAVRVAVYVVVFFQISTWRRGEFANPPKPPKQTEEETQPEATATN